MRIVHAVYGMEMGGMEVLVAQLCRLQRAQGHDVAIFAYSRLGVLGEQLAAEGFEIYVPGEAHPLQTMWRYFKCFRAQKPDVVHCHGIAPTIHATLGARLLRVSRVISTRHRVEFFPYDRIGEIQYNLMGWFCHWVTGICETTCEQLRSGTLACKGKIVRVYNGMDAVPPTDYTALGKNGFTVLFVGRLMPEKGLETLIKAIALARGKAPTLKLWIVGDGRMRDQLRKLAEELSIEEHVRFWGQHLNPAPFFSAADVFAMSSINEGLPLSLIQSMSLGTPSVVTDVDGMGEVLRLTGGGILVPVGDIEEFGKALIALAQRPELRRKLSDCALAGYRAHFTFQRMAEDYMKLYSGEQLRF